MHNLCFVGVRFYNVKYQASIITNCNFRKVDLIGFDFLTVICEKLCLKMPDSKMWCSITVIGEMWILRKLILKMSPLFA